MSKHQKPLTLGNKVDETETFLKKIDLKNEEVANNDLNDCSRADKTTDYSSCSKMKANGKSSTSFMDPVRIRDESFEESSTIRNSLLLSEDVHRCEKPNIDIPMTKRQIWRNFCILSISFLLMFTSFHSMLNLQSSLNKEDGIGIACLAIVFGFMMVSSMVLSSIFISRLGYKWAMCMAMITYVMYMAANLYPVWGIMVPGACLCGLGAGPLWTSQSTYMTQLSRWYAKLTDKREKYVLSKFSGIFYMVFNSSKIWGNLLASIVLNQPHESNKTITAKEIKDCVANDYAAVQAAETLQKPNIITIYIICGAWIGCAIIGIVVLIFLNTLTPDTIRINPGGKGSTSFTKLVVTVRHLWKSKTQKLIIPLTMYYGISQGFITADFTKSLVGCTLGIHTIGSVMLCHGISSTIIIAVIGHVVEKVGQIPFFIMAFLFHGGVQTVLIVWKPGPEHSYVFYICVALWGIGDAIIKSQVIALYGHLFVGNIEAAFGNFFMFEASGFIVSLSYSSTLSTDTKLYVVLGLLICSVVSYFSIEYVDRSRSMRDDITNGDTLTGRSGNDVEDSSVDT